MPTIRKIATIPQWEESEHKDRLSKYSRRDLIKTLRGFGFTKVSRNTDAEIKHMIWLTYQRSQRFLAKGE